MKIAVLLFTFFVSVIISNYALAERTAKVDANATSEKVLLRKFQTAFKKKKTHSGISLPLTSINISKDCSAETTCPNGTKLSCSIVGPTTSCGSSTGGVGCFKTNDDGSVEGSTGTC